MKYPTLLSFLLTAQSLLAQDIDDRDDYYRDFAIERAEEDVHIPYEDPIYRNWIRTSPVHPYTIITFPAFGQFKQRMKELNVIRLKHGIVLKLEIINSTEITPVMLTSTYFQLGKHIKDEVGAVGPAKRVGAYAGWFFAYRGQVLSWMAMAMLATPLLIAGLFQQFIHMWFPDEVIPRSEWEFPVVPVAFLQQTKREHRINKRTIQRFSVPWEVGRMNIRMNTKHVDLKSVLHPPPKKNKYKYAAWRTVKQIVGINAVLGTKKNHIERQVGDQIPLLNRVVQMWQKQAEYNSSQLNLEGSDTEVPLRNWGNLGGSERDVLKSKDNSRSGDSLNKRRGDSGESRVQITSRASNFGIGTASSADIPNKFGFSTSSEKGRKKNKSGEGSASRTRVIKKPASSETGFVNQ